MAELPTNVSTQPSVIDSNTNADPKFVLTKYEPTVVSIVGAPALGVNATRLKGGVDEDERRALMAKVEAAKAADRSKAAEEQEAQPAVSPQEGDGSNTEEKPVAEGKPEGEDSSRSKSEEEPEQRPTEEPQEPPVEDTEGGSGEDTGSEEESSEEPQEAPKGEGEGGSEEPQQPEGSADPEQAGQEATRSKAKAEEGGEESTRSKMYSVDDVANANAELLKGMQALYERVKDLLPDVDGWTVNDMLWNTLCSLSESQWIADDLNWNMLYDEVKSQMVSHRSKQLQAEDLSDEQRETLRIKKLELVDPESAKFLKEALEASRAKALVVQEEAEQKERAKALEEGKELYGHFVSEDENTDSITEAMLKVESLDAGVAATISKALGVARNVIRVKGADPLVKDVGETAVGGGFSVDPQEYLAQRVKALKDADIAEGKKPLEDGIYRATVRQTDEYKAVEQQAVGDNL